MRTEVTTDRSSEVDADVRPDGATPGSAAPAGTQTVIRTAGLTKRFAGGQLAVADLDLAVPAGSVFGFLGPNGSGKTTTIRMLLGLVAPTSGSVELLGQPIPRRASDVLPNVGALVEGPAFYPYLSGRDNLLRLDAADRAVSGRGARQRADEALGRVGLGAAATKRYRAYSLGMRQRLGLAAALLRPRELIVLDEPTNGLDPQGTREVRAIIREVAAGGTTVFLSSHLLSEVEQVCSHVGVMSHGRLIFSGTLDKLRRAADTAVRVETARPAAAAAILHTNGTAEPQIRNGHVVATLLDAQPEDLVTALVAGGVPVRQLVVSPPDLEDVFVSLTGEGFDVDG